MRIFNYRKTTVSLIFEPELFYWTFATIRYPTALIYFLLVPPISKPRPQIYSVPTLIDVRTPPPPKKKRKTKGTRNRSRKKKKKKERKKKERDRERQRERERERKRKY